MDGHSVHTQGLSTWADTRDGRRLHAMVLPGPQPSASPSVVFEAGAAATRSSWAAVQSAVADFAPAIVYDRSGLGRSAPDPVGRTLDRMADDLNDLLDHLEDVDRAGVDGSSPARFILVGHSAGGPIIRLAAARRPERIAGLVLVDPTDEAAEVLFGRGFRLAERASLAVEGLLARLGLLSKMFGWLLHSAPADDVRSDLEHEAFRPEVVRTHRQQAATFLDELAAWRTDPPDPGRAPLTVISGARTGDGMPTSVRAQAVTAHAIRAGRSPRGRHRIAEHSGHYVPITEPAVIVEEIERLART